MESDKALQVLASLLSHGRVSAAEAAFASELAALMRVDEVAIGFEKRGRANVTAISRRADFQAESELVQSLAAAMDEALAQRATVIYPPISGTAQITLSHAELVRRHGGFACTIPMASGGRIFGAVTLLRSAAEALDRETIARCEDLVCLAGPIIELKREAALSWHARLGRALAAAVRVTFAAGRWRLKAAIAGTAAILALLTLLPVEYRVAAPARLEGAVQAALVAPVDGFVRWANVRPGDRVVANQLLAELSQEELLLERRRWEGALAQHENAAPAALARADRGQFVISQAKADEARAQIDLIDTRLERSRIVAPFDGIVIQGDLSQSLGAPVQRGEVLMTIAPAGEFRLVIEVDERDIAALRQGQTGEVALGALTDRAFGFVVERITPASTAREGRNFFEVVARLDAMRASLQPGLRGVAQVRAGRRSLAWIWTHGLVDWLRISLWSWGI